MPAAVRRPSQSAARALRANDGGLRLTQLSAKPVTIPDGNTKIVNLVGTGA
jgi:hypothetical protein